MDYHVRIFTPTAELPFVGHPTIGTAHALLEAGVIEARLNALDNTQVKELEATLGTRLEVNTKLTSLM